MKPIEKCTKRTLRSLQRGKIYDGDLSFSYDPERKTLSIHRGRDGETHFSDGSIDDIFADQEVKVAQFYDLGRSTRKATRISSFASMLYNRMLMEVAKKTPFPRFKNRLYRHMGVDIPEPSEVIVAPNVFIDYINPELLRIERGVFIGEEAMVSTHYFDREKFVIGAIVIGEDSLIGGRAIVVPGTDIGRDTLVGVNSMASGNIPEETTIRPFQYSGRQRP